MTTPTILPPPSPQALELAPLPARGELRTVLATVPGWDRVELPVEEFGTATVVPEAA